MNFTVIVIISFSILIAGIIAVVKYRQIHSSYYPFLYFVWVGCLNELISFCLVMNGYYTSINSNIYVLAESLLIVYFFRQLALFRRHRMLFICLVTSLSAMWLYENLIQGHITAVTGYFRFTYSAVIVLLSIIRINSVIATARQSMLANPDFLICAGFIIYFTYKIVVEAFWLYGLSASATFQLRVYDIMAYINLFINLLYAYAILWMPRKQPFTMPS